MSDNPTTRCPEAIPEDGSSWLERYQQLRKVTESLCAPLECEDYIIQSMPEASPVKWHLAHTTWFFETFVLAEHLPQYELFDPRYRYLFNSYYEAVGPRWPRPQRGVLSRPTVAEVYRYRRHVDEHTAELLSGRHDEELAGGLDTLVLGLHHEQQHQELMVTDLKHAWSLNPLHPVYPQAPPQAGMAPPALRWLDFPGGLAEFGHAGGGFAFDNESPRHKIHLEGFRLGNRLVCNKEYLEFMNDGGYDRPELWLSDGWAARQARGWSAPLYWHEEAEGWRTVGLAGDQALALNEPVCHVSFYEAEAFARWAGARLPTEAEWEVAAANVLVSGHFLEAGRLAPHAALAADDKGPLFQLYGDVWQWTASPYIGYPGYRPTTGALGEYNGKFMCNQMVLRGASCATPRSHARRSYRNFFPPEARWQFTGIRVAQDS